jgi:hypothetical protein
MKMQTKVIGLFLGFLTSSAAAKKNDTKWNYNIDSKIARFFLLMILILANQAYTMNCCCCKPNSVDNAEIVIKNFPTKNIPITFEIGSVIWWVTGRFLWCIF